MWRFAILSISLLLSACGYQQYHPSATLSDVVAATITGVRAGNAKAQAAGGQPIGLQLCSVKQTWLIASSGSSTNALTVGADGKPEIPLTVNYSYGSSASNSNSNTIELTWTDPDCSAGSSDAAAPAASGGTTKRPATGSGGTRGGGWPIVATAEDCSRFPGRHAVPVSAGASGRVAYQCRPTGEILLYRRGPASDILQNQ